MSMELVSLIIMIVSFFVVVGIDTFRKRNRDLAEKAKKTS